MQGLPFEVKVEDTVGKVRVECSVIVGKRMGFLEYNFVL
jgi:hypothetical protein